MKVFLKYITTIALVIATATGCSLNEMDLDPIKVEHSDAVTVIGRITRFDERDVETRGVKNEDEAKLTSMAMALFKVNAAGDGLADGGCVYYQYADDQAELLFTIERGSNYDYDARYAMYVFTNMPGMASFKARDDANNEPGTTLEEMMTAFYNVEDINIPANGFPMMGSLGDTFSTNFDRDGKVFILSPLENGELTTPKVNGVTQTLLTIPMKAMFAKVNFTIEVRPDQTIEGNYSPQFTLDGYTVNNVPSKVDFSNSTNSESEVLLDSYNLQITGNTVASGANKINFSFYLPERYFDPSTKASEYAYPFKKDNKIRGQDSLYMQRYKPQLVGAKKATNVKIKGRFRDHQNHHWNVDYTIFLGEDNYGDFNIKRNCEYNNFVTIRGIQTSSDMSDEQDAISIDHRVNIERTQPGIISLRREVLLDSHFEVRPLRVRKSEIGDVEGITHVKVEIVNPTTTNWMRLERSFGDGTKENSPQTTVNGSATSIYIDNDSNSASYGKRKFFTYNLIDGVNANATDASLVNSTSVILPLSDATECCWIYVDECTEVGDEVRSGIVKASYGSYNGSEFTPANNALYPDVSYVINQRKLFQVKGVKTYNIEYHEEYLHNYDADDDYGQTEYEGMPWGLDEVQLSYDHTAVVFNSGEDWISNLIDGLINGRVQGLSPFYDFYINKYDTGVMPSEANRHEYAGYDFCNEIIQVVNGYGGYDTDESNNINILQLNQQPQSAIEYCYNKNKRNNKGQVVWEEGTSFNESQLKWYLPAIDEIEDVVMSEYSGGLKTYARFLEFQEKFYWSSQPAYSSNLAHYAGTWLGLFTRFDEKGNLYFDDVNRARATSVMYDDGKYNVVQSGTTGYQYVYMFEQDVLDIYDVKKELGNNEAFTYSYQISTLIGGTRTYSNTINSTDLIRYQGGHKFRTEKARVRCVRKL